MNLSPAWCKYFAEKGIKSVHWSDIGKGNETDSIIFKYASDDDYVIFTHDLDFGVLLAQSSEKGPSVIQIRTKDTMPEVIGNLVVTVIEKHKQHLERGALITIDKLRFRIRILPLNSE